MATSTQRIEMRVDTVIKQMAERASAVSGCSLTEYITRLIAENAPKVLKMQTEINLTNKEFDRFVEVCRVAKPPSPRILDAAECLDNEGF